MRTKKRNYRKKTIRNTKRRRKSVRRKAGMLGRTRSAPAGLLAFPPAFSRTTSVDASFNGLVIKIDDKVIIYKPIQNILAVGYRLATKTHR